MFCVHCGKPPGEGEHTRCVGARGSIDPPRFCPDCARRMVVQVTPSGWSARCSRHGERSSSNAATATD
ncbi:biotin synthase auxiliary protein BsaP [Actinophytocola sediminis]